MAAVSLIRTTCSGLPDCMGLHLGIAVTYGCLIPGFKFAKRNWFFRAIGSKTLVGLFASERFAAAVDRKLIQNPGRSMG